MHVAEFITAGSVSFLVPTCLELHTACEVDRACLCGRETIRSRIIPRAVRWYTGEINDDEDEDDDDDEEEGEDYEEGDDEDVSDHD